MRKNGSYIAANIDREYKLQQQYKNRKKRVNCKEKDCNKCYFQNICEDKENEV